jgi:hypothetical protein
MRRAGLTLLVTSGTLFIWADRVAGNYQWQRIRVPLHVDQVNEVTASFVADADIRYEVQIDLKHLPYSERRNLHLPAFAWKVQSEGVTVARPEHPPEDRTYFSADRHGFILGSFEARKGREYTLRFKVEAPRPQVQRLDPFLQIEVSPYAAKTREDRSLPLLLAGLATLLVGLGALMAGIPERHPKSAGT